MFFLPLRKGRWPWPLIFFFFLFASEGIASELLQGVFSEEVLMDLREPTYSEGVLVTTQGGVIQAHNIRIQAQLMRYSRTKVNGEQHASLRAQGNLSVKYKDYLFVGDAIEYDFLTRSGVIYGGRGAIGPWLMGGQIICLHGDGTFSITKAFATTDGNKEAAVWQLKAEKVALLPSGEVEGRSVALYFKNTPLFWLPRLSFDPLKVNESPIHYTIGWGGKQGPRLGLQYVGYTSKTLKLLGRLDYHIKHGLGAGIETRYRSLDRKTSFKTINYLARDITVNLQRQLHTRYRFQGIYKTFMEQKNLAVDFSYDKVSDIEMPSDYSESDLGIIAAGRTQLLARKQEPMWLATAQARIRLNSFQTMKQELPSLEWSYRPFFIDKIGLLYDSRWRVAYLDYDYAHETQEINDYHSTRFEMRWRFWRPIFFSNVVTVTPEAESEGIVYGNSRRGDDGHALATALVGLSINSYLAKNYFFFKHSVVPYIHYRYCFRPTLSPNEHFIFDIDDGWAKLNVVRFGLRQKISRLDAGEYCPIASADLYADAFIDTRQVKKTIPRLFLQTEWNATRRIKLLTNTAWYFPKQIWDHINVRSEWSCSTNLALAIEFRSRSRYSWRKVDPNNLMLDAFRPVEELLHSPVSDRRNTILVHSFWRFHPLLALEGLVRKGWHRRHEPDYCEFDASLLLSLPAFWSGKLSYQHVPGDHRIAIYFALRPPPKTR